MNSETAQLEQLRSVRWVQAAQSARPGLGFWLHRWTRGEFIPVFATGGIGDLTVSLGVCQRLAERTGLPVQLWTPHPAVARMFLKCWDGPRPNVQVMTRAFGGFEFWVRVNSLAFFEFSKKFDGFDHQSLSEVYLDTSSYRQGDWEHILRFHPCLDGEAARIAVASGLRRHELPFKMLGLEPSDYRIDRPEVHFLYTRKDLDHQYVTVHDGYDAQVGSIARATKTWSLSAWADLVNRLRNLGVMVVQLGGPTSRRIPGVDLDLVGMTGIEESLGILAGARCHVDGESGLVHAAYRMGVPTVAMFGPTPKEFFGYPENENLSAGDCGGCFWLTDSWLERCAVGNPAPYCMDRIKPLQVLQAIERKIGALP